jgi:hAT family C-terminal dimerisation region
MLLAPVKELSLRIQGAKYITLSELPLLWSSLIDQIQRMKSPAQMPDGKVWSANDQIFRTQTAPHISRRLLNALRRRGDSHLTSEFPLMASLLDPRFKAAFSGIVWFVPIPLRDRTVNRLRELYAKSRADAAAHAPPPALPPIPLPLPPPVLGPGLRLIPRPVAAAPPAAAPLPPANEVDRYLQTPGVPETDDLQIALKWWKTNESEFPTLAKIAKRYLPIPATSAEPERVWSAAALLCSNLRSGQLNSTSIENHLFLHRNKNLLLDAD